MQQGTAKAGRGNERCPPLQSLEHLPNANGNLQEGLLHSSQGRVTTFVAWWEKYWSLIFACPGGCTPGKSAGSAQSHLRQGLIRPVQQGSGLRRSWERQGSKAAPPVRGARTAPLSPGNSALSMQARGSKPLAESSGRAFPAPPSHLVKLPRVHRIASVSQLASANQRTRAKQPEELDDPAQIGASGKASVRVRVSGA